MRIIGCVAAFHDLRLVALACLICLLASLTTLQMLARARATQGHPRFAWVGAGGVAFGCGVWVTHFISMLAYRPNLPMTFDVQLTLLSLWFAVAGGWLALSCALLEGQVAAAWAGVAFGAAIGTMHFTGMQALQLPGLISYDAGDVMLAWAAGLVFAPWAMLRFEAGRTREATMLLASAVVGTHFIAMAAIKIVPTVAVVQGLATTALAVAVAAIGLLVLLASLGGALLDQHLERRAVGEAERFRRFTNATFEGLFILDGNLVADANLVVCDMLGRPASEIIGASITSFLAQEDHAAFSALQAKGGTTEMSLLNAAGGRHIVDVLARPFNDGPRRETVVSVRDAAGRKEAERQIQELALTDPLTGLANRLKLGDRLAHALAIAERSGDSVALLCLDLDRFKAVNDLLGHHAGDELLVEVARRLLAVTRVTDTVARLGGDEFVVVQSPMGQPENAQVLSERLVAALSEPHFIDGRRLEVTASIGVSLYPDDAVTADTLLKKADLALYRAKQDGRSQWRFFEPEMGSKQRARRELEQDLRAALANGNFRLVYQPIFDCTEMCVTGYEALLRWAHPSRGNVPPNEFIPIAEDCGLITALGRWVLETACMEAASWQKPYRIAVNLSPAQFKSPDLAAQVAGCLARSGLAAERLELEVTEGVLIDDVHSALMILGLLKEQGVSIALDDFGTGFSSLSYLRRFPFDRLKIDRSFISELATDDHAEAIVRCIIGMSSSLQLEVTAEGVETELQLNILRRMQCGQLQGYLLGRPMAASDLPFARTRGFVHVQDAI